MRVLVVGAGISGLATAVALLRDQHEVVVLERAPALGEVGAGVALAPNAMRALTALGADRYVRLLNTPPDFLRISDEVSGQERTRVVLGDVGSGLYGDYLFTTHRRDLVDALANEMGSCAITHGARVLEIRQDEDCVEAVLEDGTTVQGDILVGSDGLKSVVRAALFGADDAQFTGLLAWRTVRPAASLPWQLPEGMSLWQGGGHHVIAYPIRHGAQYYAAFYVPAAEVQREDWGNSGDVRELKSSFSHACQEVRDLAESVDGAFITGTHYREPLASWHQGRVVLVGDAAHPVLPTSGSGAGLGLEDAVSLAACLRRHGADFSAAFSEFEARRKPRTTRLLISSRADLGILHETDPAKVIANTRVYRGTSRLDPTGQARLQWLYGHDEATESAKPLSDFAKSRAHPPRRSEAQRAFTFWHEAFRPEDSIETWVSERAAYASLMDRLGEIPSDVRVQSVDCDGLRALCVVPEGGTGGPAVLHLLGGWAVYGSADDAVALAARMARAVGGWALIPDLGRAPESTPASIMSDAAQAYAWLVERVDAVIVSGEDVGGGLAVSLAAVARDAGLRPPVGLSLISPLVDVSLGGDSIDRNSRTEALLTRPRLLWLAGAYVQDCDPGDPTLSPLFGDLRGLPPIRIHAAAEEALVDDARRLADAVLTASGEVRLTLAKDSVHRFPIFDFLPETVAFLSTFASDARDWVAKAPDSSATINVTARQT